VKIYLEVISLLGGKKEDAGIQKKKTGRLLRQGREEDTSSTGDSPVRRGKRNSFWR